MSEIDSKSVYPFEVSSVTAEPAPETSRPGRSSYPPDAPYRQRCISLYRADDALLEELVARCKAAGVSSMNMSKLVRIAVRRLAGDLEQVIADELRTR